MPRYMLDTNMCIYLMNNQPEEVARRFAQCYVGDVIISSITYAELEYGVAVSANPEQERRNLASLVEDIQVAPFDAAAGVAYGQIRLATREVKKDALGKLIAAHARSLGVIVVTNNEKDFAKFADAVYVLHCFQRKPKTSKADLDLAAKRYRDLMKELGQ